MVVKKKLFILGAILGLALASASSVSASEGRTTLQNIIGEDSSCDAKSALMTDNKYTILITCKELVYPPTVDTNAYVVWATPTDGGNAIRLGALGFGRAQFRTNDSFSSLFISQEKVNTQSLGRLSQPGTVVMRGNVVIDPAAPAQIPLEVQDDELMATPTPAPRSNILSRVGTGVVITIISIIVIVVMLVLVKPFK